MIQDSQVAYSCKHSMYSIADQFLTHVLTYFSAPIPVMLSPPVLCDFGCVLELNIEVFACLFCFKSKV